MMKHMETTRVERHERGWNCAIHAIETILDTYPHDPVAQSEALHACLLAVLHYFTGEDRHLTDRLYESVIASVREKYCDA
jgi:hypothetical protein